MSRRLFDVFFVDDVCRVELVLHLVVLLEGGDVLADLLLLFLVLQLVRKELLLQLLPMFGVLLLCTKQSSQDLCARTVTFVCYQSRLQVLHRFISICLCSLTLA